MRGKPSVLSLFAGIGGICQSFTEAGCEIALANEIDRYACQTYRNSYSYPLIEGDIKELHARPDIRDSIDLIVGGFPCQPFSKAGNQLGFNDPQGRGLLFFEIMRLIDELTNNGNKPKALFLENVNRLETLDGGNTYARIVKEIEQRGYKVCCNVYDDTHDRIRGYVLNSKDYSGIPHNRSRIYIIAQDEDLCNAPFKSISKIKPSPLTAFLDNKEKAEEKYYRNEHNSKHYDLFVREITKEDTIYQYRRYYVRENKNGLCPALTANMGTGGHNVPMIKDSYGIRKLTEDECLRFQGLKGIEFPEEMASGHRYKQIGNSVTVPVVKSIAKNLVKTL